MKRSGKKDGTAKTPKFVARAKRAFARAGRKIRSENQKLGLRAIVWSNGKGAITR